MLYIDACDPLISGCQETGRIFLRGEPPFRETCDMRLGVQGWKWTEVELGEVCWHQLLATLMSGMYFLDMHIIGTYVYIYIHYLYVYMLIYIYIHMYIHILVWWFNVNPIEQILFSKILRNLGVYWGMDLLVIYDHLFTFGYGTHQHIRIYQFRSTSVDA